MEEFLPYREYDLIYLVNVFEHLDWRHFLKTVSTRLLDGGVCEVLCPDYGFPYESRFRLPMFINKSLTGRVFRDYIERFETEQNCSGLWNSLNSVNMSAVLKYCEQCHLEIVDRRNVHEKMVDRLSEDKEFRQRQRWIGWVATLLQRLMVLKVFYLPFVSRYSPYMMLEFRSRPAKSLQSDGV